MRLVYRDKDGFVRIPMPLEVCPGTKIWEQFRGREYLVFVDESFRKFFGFQFDEGHFCHAALGVPSDRYLELQELMATSVEQYRIALGCSAGDKSCEVKYSNLRRFGDAQRIGFIKQLATSIASVGGFVAVFYTSTRGYLMEKVRVSLLDESTELPEDCAALYESERSHYSHAFGGSGQPELMRRLLLLPFSAINHVTHAFNQNFRLRYDPRNPKEDSRVRDGVLELFRSARNVPEVSRVFTRCLEFQIDVSSHEDLGLQFVDVVAGEARSYFLANPLGLTENQSRKLITAKSQEETEYFDRINQIYFKIGSLSPMSRLLRQSVRHESSASPLSYFYPIMAAGALACYSDLGQPRLLEFSTSQILDQVE